ncbi:MAG TPA: metallophosphoesterase [Thermoanaerobaculia bacterium]|nr:metallophosphoesterase [Thermoanaerobaculia bacterium]
MSSRSNGRPNERLRALLFVAALAASFACKSGPPDETPTATRPATASPAAGSSIAPTPAAPIDVCPELLSGAAAPAIRPADAAIRFVAFGDFGDGSVAQFAVARAMAKYDVGKPFDFGVTLGDNFYPEGLADPASPRWKTEWERPYGPLGVRLYASLGNHDRYDPASPAAEMARSKKSASWCLPRPYYTFTAGPVQFFALDTDPIERQEDPAEITEQLAWLDRELGASTARWKVAYGHHPIHSSGAGHGESPQQKAALLPIFEKHHVALYLAGHDHHMELQRPEGGVAFVISGAGGHEQRAVDVQSNCVAWAAGLKPGFAVLDADAQRIAVEFLDTENTILFRSEIRPGPGRDCAR